MYQTHQMTETKFSCNETPQDGHFTTYATHHLQQFLNQPNQTEPNLTTETEMITTIKSLPKSQAPGPDRIRNEALHHLPDKAITFLAVTFNAILTLNYFPPSWKYALIVTIPKPDERPTNTHYGFRANRSTIHPVMTLAEDLILTFQTGQENINSNQDKTYTLTTFLDIEKAFDREWHTGLLLKMTTQGYSDCYIELLQSYLTDRSLVVTLDGVKSETKPVPAGIPQGSTTCYLGLTIDRKKHGNHTSPKQD
ncbi:hypothetical protein PR048_025643 [Dryococelus australis]|uniref:Reverse transcriptase domain-containing protein n=1 Tax=Dryococelus australis TaxID=614101 RepID=A0ABQ9GRY8_9NEOP|nr:hypothetical protein PR048_025643 [Dryococelus australis]